jgi:hypothetical protein
VATNLFGYEFKLDNDDDKLQTFATPVDDDGAVVVSTAGNIGTVVDLDGAIKSEAELVTKYREMSFQPEIESAVQDIVNEAIIMNDQEKIVEIIPDDIEASANFKEIIVDEFETVLELLEWNTQAHNIFERFYIDGRLYFHAVIDKNNIKDGIQKLQYIDPRKIRKIRETKPNNSKSPVQNINDTQKTRKEYYLYNENGFAPSPQGPMGVGYMPPSTGIRIAKDTIVHVTSGKINNNLNGGLVLSHLHNAIKPLNQLRSLEDSAIIYRIVRAPERRIFYIDTGNLPKIKAEQHIREMMAKYKNKLVYDPQTGDIRDSRKFMTMLEDFWFSRREGGKGTEIDTLQSGNMQGVVEEVELFMKKLYKSLKVPYSRFNDEATFSFGHDQQISRDELKFSDFIDQLRLRFNMLFLKILEKQLILKNIINPRDWASIRAKIRFKYARNNIITELKNSELQMDRLQRLQLADQFVGKYFSHEWIQKNILMQSDDEIAQIAKQNVKEQQMIQFNPAKVLQAPGQGGPPQDGQPPQQLALPAPNQPQQQQNEENNDENEQENQMPINMFLLKQQIKRTQDKKTAKDNKKINKVPVKKKRKR